MKKSKNRPARIIKIALVPLVCFAIAIYQLYSNKTPLIEADDIATVRFGDITRSIVATGKVQPVSQVEVKSKANGITKALCVNVGDSVKKGQLLAELDRVNLEAAVRQARSTLDAQQALLSLAIAQEQRSEVDAMNPDWEFLRTKFERQRDLYGKGVISRQAMDDAQSEYHAAANRHESLVSTINVQKAQVSQARAQLKAAQAVLDAAEEDLRNTIITSPIDGVVLTRNVEVGDAVSSILNLGSLATLLFTLGDTSVLYVKGKVDEGDVAFVHDGMQARITAEGLRDQNFEGRVTRIAPIGDEKNNVTTFEVRASITNRNGTLKANMSANAEIILEEHHNVLLIPESCISYGSDGSASVRIPDKNQKIGYQQAPVKLGVSNNIDTEVVSGLHEGDRIIKNIK